MSSKDHPAYRPDIDGLRAIAVLFVIIFHAFPRALKGGFIGVDIFFVISGFLITTILLKGLHTENFSFIDFYTRRIRRIFPALILVLVSCLIFGFFYLLSDEFHRLGKQTAGGAAFIANFLLKNEVGYFDVSADLKPLLHLWSLAIEEQFYIFWPFILFGAYRFRLNFLTIIFVVLLCSFALNIGQIRGNPTNTFYLLHTRAWELLSGGALGYMTLHHQKWLNGSIEKLLFADGNREIATANFKSILGILLIFLSAIFIKKSYAFPGWWALLPVLGAMLIISAGMTAWVNQRILANRFLVGVGLISYPLYLWHWPLLSFARIITNDNLSIALSIILILASFVLAFLTYEFVEKRVRFQKGRLVVAALIAGMVAIGISGWFVSNGVSPRLSQFDKITAAVGEWDFGSKGRLNDHMTGQPLVQLESGGEGKVAFIGDSNAEQYWARVDQLITDDSEHTKSVVFLTRGGCPPIPNVVDVRYPECRERNEYIVKKISAPEIDTVVIAASWWSYFKPGTDLSNHRYEDQLMGIGSVGADKAIRSLQGLITSLKERGKTVYLILNMPQGKAVDPKSILDRGLFETKIHNQPIELDHMLESNFRIQQFVADAAAHAGAIVINPMDSMCQDGLCPVVTSDGEPVFKDSSHIRPSYVRRYARFIDETVRGVSK